MKVEEAWSYFILHLQRLNRSKHTIKQYRLDGKQFQNYINQHFDSFSIHSARQLEQVCQSYLENLPNSFNTSSCNRKIASLKSFIKFVHFREWIPTDFSEKLESLQKDEPVLDGITNREVQILNRHYENILASPPPSPFHLISIRNYVMAQFLNEFGLKPAELITLTWNHIHDDLLYVSEERQFIIPAETQKWLHRYQEELNKMYGREHYRHLWIGISNKKSDSITEKTIERMCHEYSTIIGRRITATHFRYRKIKLLKNQEIESTQKTQILGYAQTSVFWERSRNLQVKNPSE